MGKSEKLKNSKMASKIHIIFSIVAQAIQVLAIVSSLIFLGLQTRLMSESLNNLQKEFRLKVSTDIKDAIQEINLTFLDEPEVLKSIGLSKTDLTAFIILNHLEKAFLHHREGHIKDEYYESFRELGKLYLNIDIVKTVWAKPRSRIGFHPEFREYVNSVIK